MTDTEAAVVLATLADAPAPWAQPGRHVRWKRDGCLGLVTGRDGNRIDIRWCHWHRDANYDLIPLLEFMEPGP